MFQNLEGSSLYTSSQVEEYRITAGGSTRTYSYTYDDNGNITTVSDGATTVTYTYDKANQLLSETDSATGRSQSWAYNEAGNITSRTDSDTPEKTVTYAYNDTQWGDWLSAYDGVAISNDNIGNLLNDGTWSYEWEHGRQLASMTRNSGGEVWSFAYGFDGIRTERTQTKNGTTTKWEYVYSGSQLVQMTKGADTLCFTYDAVGLPLTVTHKTGSSSTTYYYLTNAQGDVVAIIDSTGATVATYTYDAWGNPLSTPTGTIATLNPLRYRGYIWDAETELYYLQSRYYSYIEKLKEHAIFATSYTLESAQ